jgi:hypothetical protein
MVAQWFTPSESWGLKPEQFYSAYLIWQTGMGFVIAAFLQRNEALSLSGQSVSIARSRMSLSVGGKIFVAFMLTGTAIAGLFEGRNFYRQSQQRGRIEKPAEQAPSTENLQEVKPRPIDQALVLNTIAGYAESGAEVSRISAQREYWGNNFRSSPQSAVARVLYSIHYQKQGITKGPIASVTAQVWEYPNADWAKYQLRSAPFGNPPIRYGEVKTVTKFGDSVLINVIPGGTIPYVYWPSTNRVVVLRYSGQTEDEFVKQYLNRYPSSL